MTFLFIAENEWAAWGGSEELWGQTAAYLRGVGHQVYVSVKAWPKRIAQFENLSNLGCVVFPRCKPPIHRRVRRRLKRQSVQEFFLDSFPRGDLTIISQAANLNGVDWMLACRQGNRRYAVIAQSAAEQLWPSDEQAERAASGYEHAEAAYFVSQRNLELTRVQAATELPHGKVVRNPFKVDYARDWRWPAAGGDELRLACVARLEASSKGQDLLLQVLSQKKWRDRPLHVSFYGKGMNELSLKRLAAMHKLSSVTFCGHVDSVQEIWKTHHALVLPSRFEGLPLAVVEAMLCGRPCIVTDVAGNVEVVDDDDTGFVAKAPTVDFLDDAMEHAWQKRHELDQFGKRAYDSIRKVVPSNPIQIFGEELIRVAGMRSGS